MIKNYKTNVEEINNVLNWLYFLWKNTNLRQFFFNILISFKENWIYNELIKNWIKLELNLNDEEYEQKIKSFYINESFSEESKKILLFYSFNDDINKLEIIKKYLIDLIKNITLNNNDNEKLSQWLLIINNEFNKTYEKIIYKWDDVNYDKLKKNNKFLKLNKFDFLYDYNISQLKQQVVIWWRYWVWKTIFSLNLIDDLIKNNTKLKILYFWTQEVDEIAFIRRFMTNRSNENINYLFKLMEDKEKELRDFNLLLQSLTYTNNKDEVLKKLIENLNINKLLFLEVEYKSLKNWLEKIQTKIEELRRNWNTKTEYLEWEISSIEIKLKEIFKSIKSYFESNTLNIKFALNLLDNKNKEENEEIKNEIETLIDKSLNWHNIYEEDFLNTIKYMNLLKEKILDKKEIKEINDAIKELTKIKQKLSDEISEIDNTLKDVFEDTKTYLQENWVLIFNNLSSNFIEDKLEEIYKKYWNEYDIVYIIDYHQSIIPEKSLSEFELSLFVWEKTLEWSNKYNAFWVILTQLNDFFKKWWIKNNSLSYRPWQTEIRWWEWIAHKVWWVWMIFNRDVANTNDLDIEKDVDQNFVIYEIYLTKNRYWSVWLRATRRYFVLDKRKMRYIPLNKSIYDILNDDKEIIYLDQLRKIVHDKFQLSMDKIDNIIFW